MRVEILRLFIIDKTGIREFILIMLLWFVIGQFLIYIL